MAEVRLPGPESRCEAGREPGRPGPTVTVGVRRATATGVTSPGSGRAPQPPPEADTSALPAAAFSGDYGPAAGEAAPVVGVRRPMKMTTAQKRTLSQSATQAAAVKAYLEHLDGGVRNGPAVSQETLQTRIAERERRIELEADPCVRLELIQKRLDDEAALAELQRRPDPAEVAAELEAGFVDVAEAYSQRKGITYTAWREAGVPAAVLRAAGMPRTRRSAAG